MIEIKELAYEQGFSRVRILSPLPKIGGSESPHELPPGSHCDPRSGGTRNGDTRSGKSLYPEGARSALMVFLPYARDGQPMACTADGGASAAGSPAAGSPAAGSPAARIAPFARANYYREAVNRLKKLWSALRQSGGMAEGYAKGEGRIFCNSRYPEKQMAWRCGLGSLGKNSLILTPEYGSLGIIAGIFFPFDLPGDGPIEKAPYETCGSCRCCAAACPGMALSDSGGITKALCYQYLSTENRVLDEEVMRKWGSILYGCQICQDVCPVNRGKPEGNVIGPGELDGGLDPVEILGLTDDELKIRLKGSVLGQGWIKASVLKRNALLCLPRANEASREILERYASSENPVLADTARWVLGR